MMDKAAASRLWEQAKANQAKLKACKGHDFPMPKDGLSLGIRVTCTKCGGTLDGINAIWYREGVAHGKKARG